MLLDLEMLSASIEMTYSVQVVRLVLFAERRNFPFSTSKAAELGKQDKNINHVQNSEVNFRLL